MQTLAHTIQEINTWLSIEGRPYSIWSGGWIFDGGLIWDYPVVRLAQEQLAEVNKLAMHIIQMLANQNFTTVDDYELAQRNAYLAESRHLDAETWRFGYAYIVEPDGLSKIERQRERLFRQIRRLAGQTGLLAYKARLSWENVTSTSFDAVVVAPLESQYDMLRTEGTQGNNHPLDTEELVAELMAWDQEYGVIITGASLAALEFWFRRAPTGKQAIEVGKRLMQLAPDIHESLTVFRSCVALWWD